MKRMVSSQRKAGFTLIELVVVIAILGILAAVLIPRIVGFIERARIAADQATVRTLNSVTPLYRTSVSSTDPFNDETQNDNALMQRLVDFGVLSEIVEPQTKSATFTWLFETEQWYLLFQDSFYVVSSLDGLSIDTTGYFRGRLLGPYNGAAKDIEIPSYMDDILITRIWQDAFSNQGLTAVTFMDASGIVQIHARAFENNNLSSIVFPETLQRIDLRSFRNNNLTDITIPASVHTIEQQAFEGNDLTKITIGSGVAIGVNAFGSETEAFLQVYTAGGSGTYLFSDGEWVKQGS